MGHPNSSFTLGIPFASLDGRFYSRFPQGDKDITPGDARAAIPTNFVSTLDGIARGDVVNLFDFVDVASAPPSSLVESNAVTPTGFLSPVPISVSGGSYRIGAGAYTNVAGSLSPGNAVQVRGTANAAANGTTTVTLIVGTRVVTFQITTSAEVPFFPNYPVMLAQCVQSARTFQIDPAMAADVNLLIVQSYLPTVQRMQDECNGIDAIWALQDTSKMKTRVFQYQTPNVTAKTLSTYNDGERLFNLQLILDPVNGSPLVSGSPTWKVHRVGQPGDAGLCESNFQPLNDHQVNVTAGAGLNSLGESYIKAYYKKYDNTWTPALKSRLSGTFHDVFTQVPGTLRQNNGAITVTDPDYNGDGVADIRTNFGTSGGNGGRQWALGELNNVAEFHARFPGKYIATNTANIPGDYNNGIGPLPIDTNAPLYRQLDFPFQESVESFLSLAPVGTANATGWTVAGTPGATGRLAAFYEAYYVQEAMARLESDMGPSVRGAVLMHSDCNGRTPTASDLEAMRFMALACMLVERAAPCISAGTGIVWALDELLVDFGDPIGSRSMGTLNLATGQMPAVRTPDFTSGTFGKIFWANFTKCLALINGATPSTGVYPSADAAVTIPLSALPSLAGTGLKYQFLGPNYTNAKTGRTTRNQSPALNNGADVTSAGISLKPYHAQLILKVPV